MIINGEYVETIFDHNPTDRELNRWGGREWFEDAKKYGIDVFASKDRNYYMIGMLCRSRKEFSKANYYFSKIKHKSLLTLLMQDF